MGVSLWGSPIWGPTFGGLPLWGSPIGVSRYGVMPQGGLWAVLLWAVPLWGVLLWAVPLWGLLLWDVHADLPLGVSLWGSPN